MPVRVQCPHCRTMCLVDEKRLGAAVQCGACAKPFAVRMPAPTPALAARPAAPTASNDDDDVNLEWDAPGAAEMMGLKSPSTPQAVPPTPSVPIPAVSAPTCRLDIGGFTHLGRIRNRNEDSFLMQSLSWCNLDQRRDIALVVVADGVGGYEAGDQASGLVIRVVGNSIAPLLTGVLTGQLTNVTQTQLVQTLDNALQAANRIVFQRAQSSTACKGMASTAAVVLVWDGQVYIGHVGDCRVYHYRAGHLNQVTRDQTLVARMVELGQLTPQEALNHPARNEVAQAVGKHPELKPAAYQVRISAGDWLIVACDGLHTHVDARQLESTLRNAPANATLVAQQLVDMANQGGGTDNITVVAIRSS